MFVAPMSCGEIYYEILPKLLPTCRERMLPRCTMLSRLNIELIIRRLSYIFYILTKIYTLTCTTYTAVVPLLTVLPHCYCEIVIIVIFCYLFAGLALIFLRYFKIMLTVCFVASENKLLNCIPFDPSAFCYFILLVL